MEFDLELNEDPHPQFVGSINIDAQGPIKTVLHLGDNAQHQGKHTQSAFRGAYHYSVSREGDRHSKTSILLPQRDRHITMHTLTAYTRPSAKDVQDTVRPLIEEIDILYEPGRQLHRLHQLQSDLDVRLYDPGLASQYLLIMNNEAQHSSFSFITKGSHFSLHVFGMYDLVNTSMRLVFTTDASYINKIKAVEPTRFVFYRFPTLTDQPFFIYTQSICSKWLGWIKAFNGTDQVLKSFNALENFLFKNPKIASFGSTGNGQRYGRGYTK